MSLQDTSGLMHLMSKETDKLLQYYSKDMPFLSDLNNGSGDQLHFSGTPVTQQWVDWSKSWIGMTVKAVIGGTGAWTSTEVFTFKNSVLDLFRRVYVTNYGKSFVNSPLELEFYNRVRHYPVMSKDDLASIGKELYMSPDRFLGHNYTGPVTTSNNDTYFSQVVDGTFATHNTGLAERYKMTKKFFDGTLTYYVDVKVPLSYLHPAFDMPSMRCPRKGFNFDILVDMNYSSSSPYLPFVEASALTYVTCTLTTNTDSNGQFTVPRLFYQLVKLPADVEKVLIEDLNKGSVLYDSYDEFDLRPYLYSADTSTTTSFSNYLLQPAIQAPQKLYIFGGPTKSFSTITGSQVLTEKLISCQVMVNGNPLLRRVLQSHEENWEETKSCFKNLAESDDAHTKSALDFELWNSVQRIHIFDLSKAQVQSGNLTVPLSISFSATRTTGGGLACSLYALLTRKIYVKMTLSSSSLDSDVGSTPFAGQSP